MNEEELAAQIEFLEDLIDKRGFPAPGGSPNRWVELYGGSMVEMTKFEPDPSTFRSTHYYNTERNVLYKKVVSERRSDGYVVAHWQPTSTP